MCCFSDLSQTHFRWLRGIKIKIKGKTGQKLHENSKCLEKLSIFFSYFLFPGFFLTFLIINVQEPSSNLITMHQAKQQSVTTTESNYSFMAKCHFWMKMPFMIRQFFMWKVWLKVCCYVMENLRHSPRKHICEKTRQDYSAQ